MSFLLVLLGKILILMEFYLQGLHKFYHFGSKNRYREKKKKEYGDKKKREIVLMKFIFVSTAPMHVLAAHSSRRQQMSNTGPKALHANDINSVDSLAIR